jgi:preprotein translocase subunit YajC
MFNTFAILLSSATSGAGAKQQSPVMTIVMFGAIFVAMYFLMIRPQKKKQKEEQNLRDSIQIGDEITTIGGIMGRVITVKDDSIVLETGADRVKMKFTRWAIQTNDTANARMEAEKKAAEDAKKAKSEQAAIDKAVGGKGKRSKRVENKGSVEELKAEEEAAAAENETEE